VAYTSLMMVFCSQPDLFLEEDAGHSHGIHLKSVALQHAGDLDGDRLGKPAAKDSQHKANRHLSIENFLNNLLNAKVSVVLCSSAAHLRSL
jgi:hypothetical protein